MKAVVFHGIGDIRLEDVPEPTLREPTDAICGTNLHFVRGTYRAFDTRQPGWLKAKLDPQATDGARTPRASRA